MFIPLCPLHNLLIKVVSHLLMFWFDSYGGPDVQNTTENHLAKQITQLQIAKHSNVNFYWNRLSTRIILDWTNALSVFLNRLGISIYCKRDSSAWTVWPGTKSMCKREILSILGEGRKDRAAWQVGKWGGRRDKDSWSTEATFNGRSWKIRTRNYAIRAVWSQVR